MYVRRSIYLINFLSYLTHFFHFFINLNSFAIYVFIYKRLYLFIIKKVLCVLNIFCCFYLICIFLFCLFAIIKIIIIMFLVVCHINVFIYLKIYNLCITFDLFFTVVLKFNIHIILRFLYIIKELLFIVLPLINLHFASINKIVVVFN